MLELDCPAGHRPPPLDIDAAERSRCSRRPDYTPADVRRVQPAPVNAALSPGAYAAGGLLFGFTLGCVVAAAVAATRCWLDDLTGAVRWSAVSLLSIFGLLIVEVVPLVFGVLSRASVPLAALALLLGTMWTTRRRAGGGRRPRAGRTALWPQPSISLAVAGFGLVAASGIGLAFLTVAASTPIESVDALNFHLPGVIGFIRSGSLWHISQFLPGQAQANYPLNGDMLMLALALPWHSLAFVRYDGVPLLLVTGLGLYATARELGAPAAQSTLTSLALLALGPVVVPAVQDVQSDACFLAGFAVGLLFLCRHGRTGDRRDLILSGLGLGIAFGTKWYGLTDIPAVLLAWTVMSLRSRRHWRPVVQELVVLVAFVALAGGIWLVRNLVLTGDPVFDYRLRLFGLTILPAPPQTLRARFGFTLAHYATNLGVLRHYIWPGFRKLFGLNALLMMLGALGALLARATSTTDLDGTSFAISAEQTAGPLVIRDSAPADRPPRRLIDNRLLVLGLSAFLCAIAYAITPYSALGAPGLPEVGANARYGVPALILATPLLAVCLGRLRPTLRVLLELVILASLLYDLHEWIWTSWGRVLVFVAVLAGLLCAVRVSSALRFNIRRPLSAGVLVAAAGIVLVLGVYHYQRVEAQRRYVFPDPTISYVLHRYPSGARIGLSGVWVPYGVEPPAPLFGPRFGNLVGFVGPFHEHRLELYTARGPFVAALRRGRYRLLEIGTGDPIMRFPPEFYWARSAGYKMVIRSRRLILMRASI